MDDQASVMQMLQAYGEARATVWPRLADFSLLAVVRGALNAGLLALVRQPRTPAYLAEALGLDEARVAALCDVLEAHGVLLREGEAFCLQEAWATLADPNHPFPLIATVDHAFAQMYVLEQALSGVDTYWSLAPEMRLALARGVGINPASPFSPRILRTTIQATASELDILLEAGCRYLELGCGVAGGLLSMLQAYPRLRAIGVELADDLMAEAERQAAQLGVADRARFVHGDARDFDGDASFDVVFWSQFFFPAPTRRGTLVVARRALKAGGYFLAPLAQEPPAAGEDLHAEAGRQFTLDRLVYVQSGIQQMGAEALQREIEDAGFAEVQVFQTPFSRGVLGRRL